MSRSKFSTRSNSTPSSSGVVVQPLLNSVSPSSRMSRNGSYPLPRKTDENLPKSRINRCKKCDNCIKDNCGVCRNCKDMRKFGGSGTLKQSCLSRPKCINVFIPTMEKVRHIGNHETIPVLKRQIRGAGRPRKFAKLTDKNENIIKVERANKSDYEKDDYRDDVILPYEPRVFPMSDKSYNKMMTEDFFMDEDGMYTPNDHDDKKSKKYKDIPTRSWRIVEFGRKKRPKDSEKERNYPLRSCGDKLEEDDDFEDTRDEVYMVRHDRAIANSEEGGSEGETETGQGHSQTTISCTEPQSEELNSVENENTGEGEGRLRDSQVIAQEDTSRIKALEDEGEDLRTDSETSDNFKDLEGKRYYRLRQPRTALNEENEGSQMGDLGGRGEKMKAKTENSKKGAMVTRSKLMASSLSKAGLSFAGSLLKGTNSSHRSFLIPLMSHQLEVKFPELSNFEDDPNLQAILRSTKIPKFIQTGTKKQGSERGLRTRRTSGAHSKA